jgi:hypothetical protein
MPFNSTLPANNSPISSAELRGQLNGLNDNIDAAVESLLQNINTNTAANVNAVEELGLSISDPPTQGEVQEVLSKLNELIAALKRP